MQVSNMIYTRIMHIDKHQLKSFDEHAGNDDTFNSSKTKDFVETSTSSHNYDFHFLNEALA